MINLGLLYGGRSGEHDVSLCSAASVMSCLDRNKYNVIAIGISRTGKWYVQSSPVIVDNREFGKVLQIEESGDWYVNHYGKGGKLFLTEMRSGASVSVDAVFPAVHGTYCEDGTLQGLLELVDVPYVGAGVTGSSVGMNKDIAKRLLQSKGIPVVPWEAVPRSIWQREPEAVIGRILANLKLPVFVKPCCTGSSVGVSKVKSEGEIAEAIDFAFKFDNKVLAEKSINAREIECAVLGNGEPKASCLGEIIPTHEFYSYEAKYMDKNGADLKIPASLSEAAARQITDAAIDAFTVLDCCGLARVDFFLEKGSDKFYFNEINTMPGFTAISMYPKLWESSGLPYSKLLDRLIDLAFERYEMKKRISTEVSNA